MIDEPGDGGAEINPSGSIIRQIVLTGCRRSEMIGLKWAEADIEASCLRLEDSKEDESIRPIGWPVVEYLERRRIDNVGTYGRVGTRSAASRIIGSKSLKARRYPM